MINTANVCCGKSNEKCKMQSEKLKNLRLAAGSVRSSAASSGFTGFARWKKELTTLDALKPFGFPQKDKIVIVFYGNCIL
ncbi:MAG: hypothetical protein KBS54_03685 [Synergistaceae bacterium]|nr:hypothetical protein [Candidatus Equadaptatus faecalis]